MRRLVTYEWTLETLEDGEITDSDFSETLTFDKADLAGNDLGLVRDTGNEAEGIVDRSWAYVRDGKLEEYFSQPLTGSTGIKVPQRFHQELKKYIL